MTEKPDRLYSPWGSKESDTTEATFQGSKKGLTLHLKVNRNRTV